MYLFFFRFFSHICYYSILSSVHDILKQTQRIPGAFLSRIKIPESQLPPVKQLGFGKFPCRKKRGGGWEWILDRQWLLQDPKSAETQILWESWEEEKTMAK